MSFVALPFYGWLAAALAVFYLTPGRWRPACLLAISCAFYLAASPGYFVLLVAQTAIAYGGGLALAGAKTDRARQVWLVASLIPILGALSFLKVEGTLVGLLMPLGVSYYTFKIIAYLVEVYWDEGQVQRRPIAFAAFVAFAPQMVSGPIQRPFDFFPQLVTVGTGVFDPVLFEAGWFAILRGLLLKLLIGDRLGAFIAVVDAAPERYNYAVLATLAACYLLQLYADFAGYTLIAIGIGRLFGIESPPNFNAPFAAADIQDFWRRWHMSLTTWIADYVFMPLRMAVRGMGQAGLVLSLMVSMVLIGLWHALTLPYLVYGVIQGVYMSASALIKPYRERLVGRSRAFALPAHLLGIIIVFLLMTFSQLFWQAHSLQAGWLHVRLLFGVTPAGGLGFGDIRTEIADPVFACMAIAFYHGAGAPGFAWLMRPVGRFVPAWAVGGFALLLLAALTPMTGGSFIYGQF